MGKFKVYIHGRPQGQDIWPQYETANDRFYIEPFLDSAIGNDVNASLVTDIYQNNSYYTYVVRKNVVEKVARGQAGTAYFALTIRFDNAICRNVNSLYNLLNQVYEQVCVGNIIRNENGVRHFLISRFEENSSVIKQIVSIIEQNVEKVLSPFITSLGKTKDTKNLEVKDYALSDVDSPSFMDDLIKYKLVISPEKESKNEKYSSLLRQVQPIKEKRDSLATELAKIRQAVASLQEKNNVLQKNIQNLEEEKRQLEIKLSNATSDITAKYKELLQEKDGKIGEILAESEQQKTELLNAKKTIKTLKEKIQSVGQDEELLDSFKQLKDPLIMFARQMASRFPDCSKTHNPSDKLKVRLLLGNFLLLICLFVCNVCWHSSDKNSSNDADITKQKEQTSSLRINDSSSNDTNESQNNSSSLPSEVSDDTQTDPSTTPKIDLAEYNGVGGLVQGKTYTLSIQNSPDIGEFKVTGGTLNGKQFTVGFQNNVTISYFYGGNKIAVRKFSTKKQANSPQKTNKTENKVQEESQKENTNENNE